MSGWIAITRPDDEVGELRAALLPHGIAVLAYPVLSEVDWSDEPGWADAVGRLSQVRWVVVTSARAPQALRRAAQARGSWDAIAALPTAAVGEATARAARSSGLDVSLVGSAGASRLAEALLPYLRAGDLILHPCGRERRAELADTLAAAGVATLPLVVYAMEPAPVGSLPALPREPPLAVVLTSPRAASAFLAAGGNRYPTVPYLTLGETTRRLVREAGIEARALSAPTSEAIVEELCQICS